MKTWLIAIAAIVVGLALGVGGTLVEHGLGHGTLHWKDLGSTGDFRAPQLAPGEGPQPVAKVDRYPRALGRRMTMVLVPAKMPTPGKPKAPAQKKGSKPPAKPGDAPATPAAPSTGTAVPEASAPPPKVPEPTPGETPTA